MKFSDKQKKYMIRNILSVFDRTYEEAYQMIEMLEDYLNGKNDLLIYELQYRLFISEDLEYGYKLSKFIFGMFPYLYNISEEDEKKDTLKITIKIFESLFIQKYLYDNKMDKQSDSSLNILKNISEHLNIIIQTQERMIASLSHDMRTALNSISGYLTLLKNNQNKFDEEEKKYLDNAINSSNMLKYLIKDILDVNKLNSGQMEVKKSWFLLDDLMLECVEHINFHKKNNLIFKYKPLFIPYLIYHDKIHIMEILINFLTNAYKYTDNGYIEFSINYTYIYNSLRVIFTISDTGIGMTPEQKKNIFIPYNRYQKDKQGLGLGMHIAQRLADKIGAKIYIDTEIKKGSKFYLDILFKDIKEYKPNFKNKKIFFLLQSNEDEYINSKLNYLKKYNAFVKVFKKDSNLITYLLENNNTLPDILSFHTIKDNIIKFDALVYYLKNNTKFVKTYFIAENISENISLKYFDITNKHSITLSKYENLLLNNNNNLNKVDNSLEFNLLVVDDLDTNLEIFKLLVKQKYPSLNIDTANEGYEALGMCKIRKYDIIFLDLKMPGVNGYEVLKKIKEKCSNPPPIYAFTADIYKDSFNRIQEAGFSGILEKPIEIDKLYYILEGVKK